MTEISPTAVAAWLNVQRIAADLELDGLLTADAIPQLDMASYAKYRERSGSSTRTRMRMGDRDY